MSEVDLARGSAVEPGDALPPWGTEHVHDPTIVRDDDGVYWCLSTDACSTGPVRAGVQVRRSSDLLTWTFHGWAFEEVPAPAGAWSGARGLWAPEIVRVGAQWRMYYSASSFGSRRSAIGLATAPHPAGPWQDRGIVVSTDHHSTPSSARHPNAIDANVVIDGDRQWLVYGSFFGGIHVVGLDPESGMLSPAERASAGLGALTENPGTLLARRRLDADNGAIEGAFVLPRPGGGWALLASYDSLTSTYHVRAAVADAVDGPYTDRTGRSMTDLDADPWTVGVPLLGGHQLAGGPALLAPGHGSVLSEALPGGRQRQLFVHHVRDAHQPERHRLQLRRLLWTHDGWPLLSPQPYAGLLREDDDQSRWPAQAEVLQGRWELLEPGAAPTRVQHGIIRELPARPDEHALGAGRFTWRDGDGAQVSAVVHPGWDAARDRRTLVLTALTETGRVLLGTRLEGVAR